MSRLPSLATATTTEKPRRSHTTTTTTSSSSDLISGGGATPSVVVVREEEEASSSTTLMMLPTTPHVDPTSNTRSHQPHHMGMSNSRRGEGGGGNDGSTPNASHHHHTSAPKKKSHSPTTASTTVSTSSPPKPSFTFGDQGGNNEGSQAEEDPQWASVFAQTNERRRSSTGPPLTSLKRSGSLGRRRSSVKSNHDGELVGTKTKDERNDENDDDLRTFDSTFGGTRRSQVDFNMDSKQRAKFTKSLDDDQKKLLDHSLQKNDKYHWNSNFVQTQPPLSICRPNFNTTFLNEIQAAYQAPGRGIVVGGVPKAIADPVLTPPTTYRALVVSCGVFQSYGIATYPQASKDGHTICGVLENLGFDVTHLSTLPLETRAQRRRDQKAKEEAAVLANSDLLLTNGGEDTSSDDEEGASAAFKATAEEEEAKVPLVDCFTESDTDDGDESDADAVEAIAVVAPTNELDRKHSSATSQSEAELTKAELEMLPTKANIMREISKAQKYHKNNLLASNVIIFVGRAHGNPSVNVNEFSCVHPLKLMACYDTVPGRNTTYFPVEVVSAMKLEKTLTVADLAPAHPNPGLAWLHSDGAEGGHLEFQYPASLTGFKELVGPRCGMLISMVTRAMRGKAARDLRLTPNNINVFVGYRLMAMRWKFYTSAIPQQTGNFDVAAQAALIDAKKDIRSFSQAKWKMWSSFRMFGLVTDSLHKDFVTVTNQLLYKIHHSKHIHFGADDKVSISSMLTDGRLYLVFKTPEMAGKYAMSVERYMADYHAPINKRGVLQKDVMKEHHDHHHDEEKQTDGGGAAGAASPEERSSSSSPPPPPPIVVVVQQLTQRRLEISFPKTSLKTAMRAAKGWIKENLLSGACRVFSGVEICFQTSRRGERKFDWAMRAGFFAPLLHIELMDVDSTTQMRGRMHSAVQIQAWYRRHFYQSRYLKAQAVLKLHRQAAEKEMAVWQKQWKVYLDAFWLLLRNYAVENEAKVRPEQEIWERDYRMDIAEYRLRNWSLIVLDSKGRYFAVRPLRVLQRRGSTVIGPTHHLSRCLGPFKQEYFTDPCSSEGGPNPHPLGNIKQELPADLALIVSKREAAVHTIEEEEDGLAEQGRGGGGGGGPLQLDPVVLSTSTDHTSAIATPPSAYSQAYFENHHLAPFSIIRSRAEIAMAEHQAFFFIILEDDRSMIEFREAREFEAQTGHLSFLTFPAQVEHSMTDICLQQHTELLQIVSAVRRFLIIPTNRVNKDPFMLPW